MHPQRYCVYNQTNECFLSLGARLGNRPFARFKQWLGIGRRRADEGWWIRLENSIHPLGFFETRDLVYLDADLRVMHVLESYPVLRAVPLHRNAETLLALSPHSISSSRTEAGHQMVICSPREMEQRLRDMREHTRKAAQKTPEPLEAPALIPKPAQMSPHAAVAYYAEDGRLAVHAIRDLSASGLYLVTRDRWPIGAEVEINLKPSGTGDTRNPTLVAVRMRVMRWGNDGVGLEFAGACDDEMSSFDSVHVC